MKKAALFLLLLTSATLLLGQRLSPQSRISVLTMGPTQSELYAAFGHSGIRVTDPLSRLDVVYNYGIFDFDQPNFYLNFAKGKLLYKLGKQPYDRTKLYYEYNNRSITEQILNLTQAERQQLFAYLENNALPENRDYYYNYVYDNCATKIRDVLDEVFPGRITYSTQYMDEPLTFRQLMDIYLGDQPWGDVGIDLCLGLQIDQVAPARDYMFLPDYVLLALQEATIERNGETVKLVADQVDVYRAEPQPSQSSWLTPTTLFVLLFFLFGVLSHRELKYGLWYKGVDVMLLLITGLIGVLLLFLWFGTDHMSLYNFNLLWAIPFNLIAVALLFLNKSALRFKMYFLVVGVIQIALILGWGFLPQQLNMAFLPLVLTMALRSLLLYYRLPGLFK